MKNIAVPEEKSVSPLFSLGGTPVTVGKSALPLGELRSLGCEVKAAHPLRGAPRDIGGEWVLGIRLPTRPTAEQVSAVLCFRWDGNFGSALSLTVGARSGGWIARAWIWSRHPVMTALRISRSITIVAFYNGEPISVLRSQALSEQSFRSIEFATDLSNEADRRPGKQSLDLDEQLAYWETFTLTDTWDKLLSATDFLQVGWLREFRNGLRYAINVIGHRPAVPVLTDADKSHWAEGDRPCPQDFWDLSILPLAQVLRGDVSILEFVRNNTASNMLLVIADEDSQRSQNPFNELRWLVGILAECALLADTRTQFGQRVVFSTLDVQSHQPVEIPNDELTVENAKKYWRNIPSVIALNVGELVTANMQPAELELIVEKIKHIRLGCGSVEAEHAIATMTDEANILNRWTIPWGARVQTNIGPFTEIVFYSYADEISILMKTPQMHYRWAAFNLRKNAWNLRHVFTNRFEDISENITDSQLADDAERAFKLILASIVRDFVVLDERESAFAVRRDSAPQRRHPDDKSPQIIYIPRIRYTQSADTNGLEKGLEYELRRPHHVRAHQRRADTASSFQRILAERYGFRLEPGFTFVKPHQRGGIAPDREVIYRSRSAMQSLYGVDMSIESNGRSNWFQFERDVHDAMMNAGFKVDHVASAKNGDAGVDVFAADSTGKEFWAIQCKCYAPKRKVGPSVVRELIGAIAAYPLGTCGMIVTTSGYSSGAIELAERSGIALRLLSVGADDQACHLSEV